MSEAAIRALPKVVLHDHLDGALRAGTVAELARAKEVEALTRPPGELARWVVEQCQGSLAGYLQVSDLVVGLLGGDPAALYRVAREYAHDLAADGVIYAEVRWAPEEVAVGGLGLEEVVDAVRHGLRDGVADVEAAGAALRVEQILCALRTGDRSADIAELVLSNLGNGVVAFDLAGAEEGFPPGRHRAALDLLARNGVPVTLHAGEGAGAESIRQALDDGHAARIGHGIRIVDDISGDDVLGPLAARVRDEGIVLELCPSSNLQTRAFAGPFDDYPLVRLDRLGFAVTVSPDNRLLSGTSVTRELLRLQESFGVGPADILRYQLNAANAAFVTAVERAELSSALRAGFGATASSRCPDR